MISLGGVYEKIGSWFERGAVVLQWLRVLLGDADEVVWEPTGAAGDGVDYVTSERRVRIAVQCKTREQKPWTASALRPVITAAAAQLLAGEVERFRFVTDLKPAQLIAAIADIDRQRPDQWLATETAFREPLLRQLGWPGHGEPGPWLTILRRVEVWITSQPVFREWIWSAAHALTSPEGPEKLLSALADLTVPSSLGRRWDAAALREHVEAAGVRLPARRSDDARERVEAMTSAFLGRVQAARRGRPPIARTESQRLSDAVVPATSGLWIVHGGAGSGKTAVLAELVDALRSQHATVLAITPSAVADPGFGEAGFTGFLHLLGGPGPVLVIDQLDQAAAMQAHVLDATLRWIAAALRLGLRVVVGCRTVDVEQETRLAAVLKAPGIDHHEIPVGELPEQDVAEALKPYGIPLDELPPDLRRLVRTPLALTLLLDLVARSGQWRLASSTVDLVERWCEELERRYGGGVVAAIDAIADAMDRDAVIAVDRTLLPAVHGTIIDRLIADGVLLRESGNCVRLFHQVIADTRTAVRWCADSDEHAFLRRLGPRHAQGIRHARLARLCVPRLANRGARGAAMLGALVCHPDVRPLLRRALLLGLADLEAIRQPVLQEVQAWLRDGRRRDLVLRTVVYGQPAWTDALDGWMDATWSGADDALRALLLDTCASVARRRGDAVAAHLVLWQRTTPGTIEQARWIFWQDPAEDSEQLFELRLGYLASAPDQLMRIDWTAFIERHPRRALRLLVALLGRVGADCASARADSWMHSWPKQPPDAMLAIGADVVAALAPWWSRLAINEPYQVHLASDGELPGIVENVVQLLAACGAAACSRGHRSWSDLVALLPWPLRWLDGWLLLETGSQLAASTPGPVLAEAAWWFCSEPRWAHLQVGLFSEGPSYALAERFLRSIAPGLDSDGYAALEGWLLAYPDTWTPDEERGRFAVAQAGSALLPNDLGHTCLLLLPALPRERWSVEARTIHAGLVDKFGAGGAHRFRRPTMEWGWERSSVPDDAARRWSAAQWLAQLGVAPVSDRRPRQIGKGVIGHFDRAALIDQLGRIAAENPRRFLPIAEELFAARDPVAANTRAVLLGELSKTSPPDRGAAGWAPITDAELIGLLTPAALQDDPAAVRELARAVERRPLAPWPDTVIDLLIALVTSEGREYAAAAQRRHDLATFRLNEATCMAIAALAALAEKRPAWQPRLLHLAQELAERPNPGVQAGAATLAAACRPTDPARCDAILLRVCRDPLVASEHDVNHALRWLAVWGPSGPTQEQARQLIIALAAHPEEAIAEYAGIGLALLRARDRLTHAQLTALLAGNAEARRSAARVVARWLHEPDAAPWMKEYVLALAGDDEARVREAVVWGLTTREAATIVEDRVFFHRLVRTRAAQDHLERMIEACDRHGRLLELEEEILAVARRALDDAPPTAEHWQALQVATKIGELLLRLAETANQQARSATAERALDALDELVEAGRWRPYEVWKAMTSLEDN